MKTIANYSPLSFINVIEKNVVQAHLLKMQVTYVGQCKMQKTKLLPFESKKSAPSLKVVPLKSSIVLI